MNQTFEDFQAQKLKEGYDEVLQRVWEPHFANEMHAHPFDTDARVAQGEYWLTINGQTIHYTTGDTFQVASGVMHSEKYGAECAIFWAARKNHSTKG